MLSLRRRRHGAKHGEPKVRSGPPGDSWPCTKHYCRRPHPYSNETRFYPGLHTEAMCSTSALPVRPPASVHERTILCVCNAMCSWQNSGPHGSETAAPTRGTATGHARYAVCYTYDGGKGARRERGNTVCRSPVRERRKAVRRKTAIFFSLFFFLDGKKTMLLRVQTITDGRGPYG